MRKKLQIIDQPAERRDARENKEKILAALDRLLARFSIEEICMDAVAAEAGVGKGTLYRHFKDRSSLCHALLDEAARKLQNDTIKNAKEPLMAFIERLVAFYFDNLKLLCEATAAAKTQEQRFAHPARAWQHYELTRRLQVKDAARLADWILSLLDPHLFLWQLQRGDSRQAIAASVKGFIERGVHVD